MTKSMLTAAGCATLLWVGTALATPTVQQRCDAARITAWKVYASCVEAVVAQDAKGLSFNEAKAFARCRHTYFKKWTEFQNPNRKPPLAGSTCIDVRFADNGDQTVTDHLTGLVWEKKDDSGGIHDNDNVYSWSGGSGGYLKEDGTAFTDFLGSMNSGGGFAGANGWRLPTLVELQTVVRDFACTGPVLSPTCTCGSGPLSPCIDTTFGPTQTFLYYSSTSDVRFLFTAWVVGFDFGHPTASVKNGSDIYVRAVRGGL